MKTYQFTPWRVVHSEECGWEVWTACDETPGNLSNYTVAYDIQNEDEARLLATAPQLYSLLHEMITTAGRPNTPEGDLTISQEFFKRARTLLWNLDKPQTNA